jgi:hypothetical protein
VRNTGSLTSSRLRSTPRFGPSATSANQLANSTGISSVSATPTEVSTWWPACSANAVTSGPATNSITVRGASLLALVRQVSGWVEEHQDGIWTSRADYDGTSRVAG